MMLSNDLVSNRRPANNGTGSSTGASDESRDKNISGSRTCFVERVFPPSSNLLLPLLDANKHTPRLSDGSDGTWHVLCLTRHEERDCLVSLACPFNVNPSAISVEAMNDGKTAKRIIFDRPLDMMMWHVAAAAEAEV